MGLAPPRPSGGLARRVWQLDGSWQTPDSSELERAEKTIKAENFQVYQTTNVTQGVLRVTGRWCSDCLGILVCICINDQAEVIIRPLTSEPKLPICVRVIATSCLMEKQLQLPRHHNHNVQRKVQSFAFRSPMSEDRTVQIWRPCGQTSTRTLLKCETQKCHQHHTIQHITTYNRQYLSLSHSQWIWLCMIHGYGHVNCTPKSNHLSSDGVFVHTCGLNFIFISQV